MDLIRGSIGIQHSAKCPTMERRSATNKSCPRGIAGKAREKKF
jgi:hypothetical protein